LPPAAGHPLGCGPGGLAKIAVGIAAAAALATAGCAPSADLEMAGKFQAAQQAFDNASSRDDFLRVAGLYQEILDSGLVSGPVLYNQGNAYMRAGQRGRAVACYRQARRYLPRNPLSLRVDRLDANLGYALGARAGVEPSRSLPDQLLFWGDWISYGGKFRLAAWAACAAFALAVAALFAPRARVLRGLAWAALAIALLAAFSAAYDWRRYEWVEHGVIVRDGVIARKGNAASYEPAFDQPLGEATEFQVVERRSRWLLIRLAGGQEGWIEQDAAVVF
jgi:tetratricopeptide (TPR) repeat protein